MNKKKNLKNHFEQRVHNSENGTRVKQEKFEVTLGS